MAKQLNILLENLGVPSDKILIDPTTGSVGYGMEYCYSIMERLRQAALTQNDDKLQYPIINNIAEEVWKTKEAKLPSDVKVGRRVITGSEPGECDSVKRVAGWVGSIDITQSEDIGAYTGSI